MKEIPILFSGPMMLANLRGAKDVTRRIVKPGRGQAWMPNGVPSEVVRWEHRKDGWWSMQIGEPNRIVHCGVEMDGGHIGCIRCPYGSPGDLLWAKETWRPFWHPELYCCIQYASDSSYRKPEFANEERGHRFADMCEQSGDNAERWHPSIHMWREMARFTAKIVSVRVERLQEITEADCAREGIATHFNGHPIGGLRHEYAALWDSINGPGAWERNDWVWRIEYRNPHKEYA